MPTGREALDRLEGWVWEDEEHGARLTGARSASWDTGFALQALATVDECGRAAEALDKGADFLRRQQIGVSFEGYREAFRNDPRGGWCFAGGWHGWPVTDCTAEAVLGILAVDGGSADRNSLEDAVGFMLRGQNRDGGFGSYESRRSAIGLEWLNPAEMFGDSMTEHSHVECTASCLAAFAATGAFFPEITDPKVTDAVERADAWLRRTQANDGSWRGVWGVQFIYGTFFGIRGLIAAGAPPGDPALRLACRWLLDRQHEDGGWGEHHSGCLTGRYVAHETCQVIQTAWAVTALLEAGESNWTAVSRGVQFLLDQQETTGAWPRQDMAGSSSARRFWTTNSIDSTFPFWRWASTRSGARPVSIRAGLHRDVAEASGILTQEVPASTALVPQPEHRHARSIDPCNDLIPETSCRTIRTAAPPGDRPPAPSPIFLRKT